MQDSFITERIGDISIISTQRDLAQRELSKFFKPVTDTQDKKESLVKEIKPIT